MNDHRVVFVSGDLFRSRSQTLTNAINVAGVMGAGIAKEFKRRFPDMFEDYKRKCKNHEVIVGEPYVWRPDGTGGKWVLNFPTKKHWRGSSQIAWIEEGLDYLVLNYRNWGITSLAVPALGCSLGGLRWNDVKPLLESRLGMLKIPVEVYHPLQGVIAESESLGAVTGVTKSNPKRRGKNKSIRQLPLL